MKEKKGSPVAGLDCLMQGVAMAETPLLPFIRSIFSINAPLEKGGGRGVFSLELCANKSTYLVMPSHKSK
jgi:hypothetical protein